MAVRTGFLSPVRVVICTLAVVLVSSPAPATDKGKDEWKRLGQKRVEQRAERDEIDVGADDGAFRQIKLEIDGADVQFARVRVVYASGADDDIEVRDKIKRGGQTRAIDLKGGKRAIRKVVLVYKTERGADRDARVVLFGRK
jgi:Protein of unknown function (DUF2541)